MTHRSELDVLRTQIEQTNFALLDLLSQRAELVTQVQRVKTRDGIPTFVPERERKMLADLVRRNRGPFSSETVSHLFQEIFRASVALMEAEEGELRRVSRASRHEDLCFPVGKTLVGAEPIVIAGPCAVESEEQVEEVAQLLVALGVGLMRAGAYKPRSSPYSFQGLGQRGLEILRQVGRRHGLGTVTEVTDTRSVELVAAHADVLQVGARNMHNYELLREVGRCGKPVLLKRGLAATLDELLWSAEYVVAEGNQRVILCERGIRTFNRETRNTLDIAAVPLLRQRTYLPVVVDVSHAAGRRDILAPLGRAALAAGANGLMVEVHPCPAVARSDSQQQLDFDSFRRFMREVGLARAARSVA
jgi:3-deoxy-7-phosphoheptulonate synthase/chorismate mutase